jgi:2-keto-4-pentenoate hydratase/2-oxohepta-3-ene-1,7-dioic acid hydratase in catechol pathway
MRLATFQGEGGPRTGAIVGDAVVDLHAADAAVPATMRELLAQGDEGLKRAAAAAARGQRRPLKEVKLLAPVPDPQKIICVGLNYADHAAESGTAVGEEPVIFSKFPTTICNPDDPIRLPKIGADVDYEAELVVVIGRGGKNIPRQNALQHVAGYCCGHDVSARDWQKGKPGGQWTLGKGFDTFAPLGPWIVTPDEAGDVNNLRIQLRLNGRTMQDSSTKQLVFKVDYLVSYISNVITLLPCDLIYTGTPPGVGAARKPPVFMKAGDVAEVVIEGLGVLKNPVEKE